jgi:hypothetical protein
MLESEHAADPSALTIVVAEAAATVVCAASIRLERGTEFATLCGGADPPGVAPTRDLPSNRGLPGEPRRRPRLPLPRDGRVGRQPSDPRTSRLHRGDGHDAIRLVATDASSSRSLACVADVSRLRGDLDRRAAAWFGRQHPGAVRSLRSATLCPPQRSPRPQPAAARRGAAPGPLPTRARGRERHPATPPVAEGLDAAGAGAVLPIRPAQRWHRAPAPSQRRTSTASVTPAA